MEALSPWTLAAKCAGRIVFAASFFPLAAALVLALTQTLSEATIAVYAGGILLIVAGIAATACTLVSGRSESRTDRAGCGWLGATTISFAAQAVLLFALAVAWVGFEHSRATDSRPKGTPETHGAPRRSHRAPRSARA